MAPAPAYDCLHCGQKCSSSSGLLRHTKSKHPELNLPPNVKDYTRIHHCHLNACPCATDGSFLNEPTPEPQPAPPAHPNDLNNPWAPFEDRLAFDWAHYHYVRLQSSADVIGEGLDLWRATVIKHKSEHGPSASNGVPWKNADELYATIDAIHSGDIGWKTYQFQYTGPKPSTPPQWMETSYELNTRDVLAILEQQISSTEFNGQFEYTPYQEYDSEGDRVYSHLMSGYWATREADTIAKDQSAHGSMLVPVIAGSDKTTVSVATGHQEYHPVYASAGNISNTARRGHGNAVVPVAFLPIPKTSKCQRKKPEFQKFSRQLYHACLEVVFSPLKPHMSKPKIVKCPDGHFRRAIFSLGPYIADYPEQVWLAGIVSNWCPKCDARPTNLDDPGSHRWLHEKTDFLIMNFDPGILWDEFGVRHDIVPFTHSFPRADIHELLAPDLLHQLIKGTFKDHLVDWVAEYLHITHGEKKALEIVEDIDHRISAVPPFPGLRRFPDGWDYNQWTGDDSKALMKVFLAAIAGYVPSAMVQCIAAFMDACYIAHRNAITGPALEYFRCCVERFHQLRKIFIQAGVRTTISLPRQHALKHFLYAIQFFGSPNGLCSSITESKHIKAVKEPWRRSSRFRALIQMLRTIVRMDKMASLRQIFLDRGMLFGSTSSYMAGARTGEDNTGGGAVFDDASGDEVEEDDEAAQLGEQVQGSFFDVKLASKFQYGYPRGLHQLAAYIHQPKFPFALQQFLYLYDNPNSAPLLPAIENLPRFDGEIKVYHSAVSIFYAPSDLCGAGGMKREIIRSTPHFYGHPRRDTVFVVLDESKLGMQGIEIGRVLLFFSFSYRRKDFSCALINWFVHDDNPDEDTGMWPVQLECDRKGVPNVEVVELDSIARAAHLLPIYGSTRVPDDFSHHDALDSFQSFFVNRFVDHHAHEFLTTN
ncbi:hypothetical protein BYT27DRAFT_7226421 [Phlegmacium glaucopus]|nr:hypothetical protein BYT27DRAFT_7226421 [Phlegmacium glaucopus]